MKSERKLLLAEDHPILRSGLKVLLELNEKYSFRVIEAENGIEAYKKLKKDKMDLAIIDLNMPELDGISLLRKLQTEGIRVNVLIFSSHNDECLIQQSIEFGALGYVLKNSGAEEFYKAIDTVIKGKKYYSNEVSQQLLIPKKGKKGLYSEILSNREIQILKLIAKDMTNESIADILNISKRTVEVHRRNIRNKLNITTSNGLLKFALENDFKENC